MITPLRIPNTPDGNEFIADVRKLIRGIGNTKLYARNPNRKQFNPTGTWRRRRDLPLRHATSYCFYIWAKPTVDAARLWGMVETVRKIYALHGKTVTL